MIFGATLLPRRDEEELELPEEQFSMVRDAIRHAICDPLPMFEK